MFENYFKNDTSLDEGEEIEAIIHHHFATFLGQFLKIAILPVLLISLIFFFGFSYIESILDSSTLSIVMLVVFVVWATYAFYHWYVWYFDAYIITNKKVIITEQARIFEKKIITTTFAKIQDISVNFKGLWQTILRYGTVHIQTAGEDTDLRLQDVANPQGVARKILNIRDNNSVPRKKKENIEIMEENN